MGLRFCDSDDADYVLAAFDTTLDYGKLCRVCDLIRAGKPYIATHPDFNCPTEHGFIPDLGAFMALIHASTGRWADVVIGKPNRGIVDEALARTGFALHEMAMVGDRALHRCCDRRESLHDGHSRPLWRSKTQRCRHIGCKA